VGRREERIAEARALEILQSEGDRQEATDFTPDDWEKIKSRLRNGQVSFRQLADCNPQRPSHWLKKRCDEGRTRVTRVNNDKDEAVSRGPDIRGVNRQESRG
jgi:phage terminase large subunit